VQVDALLARFGVVRSGGEHRKRFPPPHRRRRSTPGVVPIDFPFGKAAQYFVERDPPLQPRERSAKAVVDAAAEREQLSDVAVDVEAIWIRVLAVVAIRGSAQAEQGAP